MQVEIDEGLYKLHKKAGCMKQLKLWMFLICFALGLDSSEEKKCFVSRAYAVCWVTPNFWENALTAEKKTQKIYKRLSEGVYTTRNGKFTQNCVSYIYV